MRVAKLSAIILSFALNFWLNVILAIAISNESDKCILPSRVDAITKTKDGNTYIFEGNEYWLLEGHGLAVKYPRLIANGWPGLPNDIDAAFTGRDGKTFFFKADKYWEFENQVPANVNPKLISTGFKDIPNDLDAALLWSGNNEVYFFKGDQYWRLSSRSSIKSKPNSISLWLGLPSNLSAAFQWEDKKSYFFQGEEYYLFDDHQFKVPKLVDDPYPRKISTWFKCKSKTIRSSSSSQENTSTISERSYLSTISYEPPNGLKSSQEDDENKSVISEESREDSNEGSASNSDTTGEDDRDMILSVTGKVDLNLNSNYSTDRPIIETNSKEYNLNAKAKAHISRIPNKASSSLKASFFIVILLIVSCICLSEFQKNVKIFED